MMIEEDERIRTSLLEQEEDIYDEDGNVRSDFLTLAVTHLFHHKTPLPEFEDGLRHIVAEFLAAVPYRGGFRPAMRNFPPLRIDELCGLEEFLVEHAALIEPIVQEAIEGAKAVHKAME